MCCFHSLKNTAKIFQVLTAVGMKITVCWDTALCSFIKLEQCFRGAYCLHNHRIDDGYSKHLSNNNIFPGYQPCQLVKRQKTNVSRTISVLVFRALMYLENQSMSYIGLPEFHVHDGVLANGTSLPPLIFFHTCLLIFLSKLVIIWAASASVHERGTRAGLHMTWTDSPDTSVP
jgi:hypothetical protein